MDCYNCRCVLCSSTIYTLKARIVCCKPAICIEGCNLELPATCECCKPGLPPEDVCICLEWTDYCKLELVAGLAFSRQGRIDLDCTLSVNTTFSSGTLWESLISNSSQIICTCATYSIQKGLKVTIAFSNSREQQEISLNVAHNFIIRAIQVCC